MENGETQTWLEFSTACKYMTEEKAIELNQLSEEVSRLLNYMINNPEKFQ